MKERIAFYAKRIKEGRLKEMWRQTVWIYGYGKKHWLAMIIYTLMGLVGTVVSLGVSFASRDLVNIITGFQAGKLIQTFSIMIGLGIANSILSQITSYVSALVGMRVDAEIKADIFEKILVTDWESLTNYHTGDLLTRWNTDASSISNGILNYVPNAIIYLFRFISAFAVVIVNDASFAIFAFLGMPVSLILSKTLMRRMVNNNQRSAAMGAKMSGFNQEAFSNVQTIKAFDLIRLYVQRLKQLQKEYITMKLDFQKMSIWTSLLMTTVGLLVSYAAYGWGIYRVWSGAIDYGTMTMFLGLSGTLTGTLHNLTSLVPGAIALTTSAGRLMDIVEMPREDDGKREEVEAFLEENRDRGIGLTIDHLTYAYKTGTQVFENATMEARPHEIVGLVGPSGEGKTTMMRLLLSLVPPQGGEAYFWAGENKEKRGFDISPATRQLFSYVPQGNTMFSGTIAQNMRNVKEDASDEEIIAALKQACAWSFVEKLPDGIYSVLHERGGGLSEGQAQRLAIARALLRDTPILLLDEATSALDVATERQVLRNIMGGERPKTCIVTTHRPTALSMCKRVYAIRNKQCALLNAEEIKDMIDNF
ncbi:MAG: ABC transporter ATP-binding protein [Lachnospiraceae bacterium]|nr:ABC transporter ATP-binding protein [Lachnospiraceae bacterium]